MKVTSYSAKTVIATVVIVAFSIVTSLIVISLFLPTGKISYTTISSPLVATTTPATTTPIVASTTPVFIVTHISPPSIIKSAYFTSWSAGTPSFQKEMFSLVQGTELNSLVIDVKDYSGRVSFITDNPLIKATGSPEERISDIEHMIAKLHAQGIYVIGRVAVFQDPFIVKVHPEWAIHDETGKIWKDKGGAYWVDPDSKGMWNYVGEIAKQAYAVGFDEINFDYVRFPSDGITNAVFDKSASTTKESVITSFFSYLHDTLSPLGIPISADVFGQTTSDTGDMGIGQHFENVLPYFNYVDPMVYPSHYITNFLGFVKPAQHPYAIVRYELDYAEARSLKASVLTITIASTTASTTTTTTKVLYTPAIIRPWLQAFDLGAIYTPDMVHAQIQATADAGAEGWLLWNAGSVYNREFVLPFEYATTTAKSISTSTHIQ